MPASRPDPHTPLHVLGSHIPKKMLCFVTLATERLQVAKTVWKQFHNEATAWFDYDESGNRQITVVYKKGTPINMKRSVPPWEAGSLPPPFMIQLQDEAKARAKAEAAGRVRHGGTGVRRLHRSY